MIRNSRERAAWSLRTLLEAPLPPEANVEITLFANYFGTVKGTHRFNDPALYTDKRWWTRVADEIKEMLKFRRNKKHV